MQSIEPEYIEDNHKLFLRISGNLFKGQKPSSSMIRQQGDDGLSVDWCRYSSAVQCQERGDGEIDGVVSFLAECIRNIEIELPSLPPRLEVKHNPIDNNRAHTLVRRIPENKQDKKVVRNLLYGCIIFEILSPLMDNSSLEKLSH